MTRSKRLKRFEFLFTRTNPRPTATKYHTMITAPTRPTSKPKSNRPTRQLRPSFNNPKNPIDELLLGPFISSIVKQLGENTCNKKVILLRSLIPVVTDCLSSVIQSFTSSDKMKDNNSMNILLAQALFRKNPMHSPRSTMQKTITKLINEEIVALQVENKQNKYKANSPIIYELFHNYDHDGDSYITIEEVKSLLHDVGKILGFNVLEAHRLVKLLDFHGTGMVDFHDFQIGMTQLFKEEQLKSALNFVTLEKENPHDIHFRMMSHRDEYLLEHAEMKLLQMLKKRNYNFRTLFNELDRNQDNSISLQELADALRSLSEELGNAMVSNSEEKKKIFTAETVALLLSKEKIDQDGDHCIDYVEFQKYCTKMLTQHGIAIARRSSMVAMQIARQNLWTQAKKAIQRAIFQYEALERVFHSSETRSNDIDPEEMTLPTVLKNKAEARNQLNCTKELIDQANKLIELGFNNDEYRHLMELAVVTDVAQLAAKTVVHIYFQSVIAALKLHEELNQANVTLAATFDRFSILKVNALDLDYKFKKTNNTFANPHTRHTVTALKEALTKSIHMRHKIPHHLVSELDLTNVQEFILQLNHLEKLSNTAASEIQDSFILAQANNALESALRSGSLNAFARSLVAAICKSASPQNLFAAVFFQTSKEQATCVACGSEHVRSVFQQQDQEQDQEQDKENANENENENEKKSQTVRIGTTSISGDDLGFDCLRIGQQHKKDHFMLPLLTDHHTTHPFAYLYIEKKNGKPLSPRLTRFIKTLGDMSSERMLQLEQLDRLIVLTKHATKVLTNVSNASTFIGLRIGLSGIRFLEGSKKFEEMATQIQFIKARDARTLMAASESNLEPRSARCKGPCLAWRAGTMVHNISVVVAVADMTSNVHHKNIFAATQQIAKLCLSKSSLQWHLGMDVERMFDVEYGKMIDNGKVV